jgi:hypothetical protein
MAHETDRDIFGPWQNGFGYDQAFNGKTWEIRRGHDFEQASSTIAAKLREEHARRFGRLDVVIDGDRVYVRAVRGAVQTS